MAILSAKTTEKFDAAAMKGVNQVLGKSSTAALGGAATRKTKPHDLAVPHDVYTLALNGFDKGLSGAKRTSLRYLVMSGSRAVAAAELERSSKSTAPKLSHINQGSLVSASLAALESAEQLPATRKDDFDLRLLQIPAIHAIALWLHGKNNDLLIPLDPGFNESAGGAVVAAPLTPEKFFSSLQSQADLVSGFDDSPGRSVNQTLTKSTRTNAEKNTGTRIRRKAVTKAAKRPVANLAKKKVAKGAKKSVGKTAGKKVAKRAKTSVEKTVEKTVAERARKSVATTVRKKVAKGVKKSVLETARKKVGKGSRKSAAKTVKKRVAKVATNSVTNPLARIAKGVDVARAAISPSVTTIRVRPTTTFQQSSPPVKLAKMTAVQSGCLAAAAAMGVTIGADVDIDVARTERGTVSVGDTLRFSTLQLPVTNLDVVGEEVSPGFSIQAGQLANTLADLGQTNGVWTR